MNSSHNALATHALFELDNSDSLKIPKEVTVFLESKEFPWEALGKELTQFVQMCVDKIPKNERLKGKIHPSAVIEGDVVVSEGAIVEAGAYIAGPTFIAPGSEVRHAAYVRGSVYLCSGAVIGHTSEAKGCLLLPNAKAAHFAYVGDSILGVDCNLGAGTKLANLRFDHKQIIIKYKEEIYSTNLKKFGAILGNRSQTGCNSVTNPGTVFLPNAAVRPNSTSSGVTGRSGNR